MNAYEIVMESRRKLVEQVISNMKKGYIFTEKKWDAQVLAPQNPVSHVRYKGGNRIRLIQQVVEKGYQDPRWMTRRHLQEQGYYIKKGEKQTICEKWIFTKKEKYLDEDGQEKVREVELEKPMVSYFGVFNAEQIKDFPPLVQQEDQELSETMKIGMDCICSSECRIIECAQPEAYYAPGLDKIVLPLRQMFKDEESYVATVLHEMVHSTGHHSRLNRNIENPFGSIEYAKEELRAELGSMFLKADLGLSMQGEHFQDHSNYLKSWISVLEDDYNELFRAASDAERASIRIMDRYQEYKKNPEIGRKPQNIKDVTLTPVK